MEGETCEDDLPVGLVGDEIDGVAVFFALFGEDGPQLLQRFQRVDHAGGVVGVVEDHALGVGSQGGGEGVEVDLEVLHLRGNDHHLAAVALHEDLVLREVGGEEDILVPGTGQAPEGGAQRGRRAAGQKTKPQILPKGV